MENLTSGEAVLHPIPLFQQLLWLALAPTVHTLTDSGLADK
jgi:hypothetical protein